MFIAKKVTEKILFLKPHFSCESTIWMYLVLDIRNLVSACFPCFVSGSCFLLRFVKGFMVSSFILFDWSLEEKLEKSQLLKTSPLKDFDMTAVICHWKENLLYSMYKKSN